MQLKAVFFAFVIVESVFSCALLTSCDVEPSCAADGVCVWSNECGYTCTSPKTRPATTDRTNLPPIKTSPATTDRTNLPPIKTSLATTDSTNLPTIAPSIPNPVENARREESTCGPSCDPEPSCDSTGDNLICQYFGEECGYGCAVQAGVPECTDGATTQIDCNECVCEGGRWACDDSVCCENQTQCVSDPCTGYETRCPEAAYCHSDYCNGGCDAIYFNGQGKEVCKCPTVDCKAECRFGYVQDENGCDTCQCKKKPPRCDPKEDIDICDPCQCVNGNIVCRDEMACNLECPSGFQKDGNGCDTCSCKKEEPCSLEPCKDDCTFGTKVDENDCPTCECKEEPCATVACENKCPFGYQENKDGCQTCDCKECEPKENANPCDPCFCLDGKMVCADPVPCLIECENGFKKTSDGCDTCQCKEKPGVECHNLVCDITCKFGNKEDRHGCPTCQCQENPKCDDVSCDNFCVYGRQLDEEGCPTCNCKDCDGLEDHSPCDSCTCQDGVLKCEDQEECDLQCDNGFETNDDGCAVCKCAECKRGDTEIDEENCESKYCSKAGSWIQTSDGCIECPELKCEEDCDKHKIDTDGCETCSCADPCEENEESCKRICPLGYLRDDDGCKTCECKELEDCNDVKCALFCPNGFKKNHLGCDICACSECTVDDCGEFPKDLELKECPDGSLSGSTGLCVQTDEGCQWEMTQHGCPCPAVRCEPCLYGNKIDENGCLSCDCEDEPECGDECEDFDCRYPLQDRCGCWYCPELDCEDVFCTMVVCDDDEQKLELPGECCPRCHKKPETDCECDELECPDGTSPLVVPGVLDENRCKCPSTCVPKSECSLVDCEDLEECDIFTHKIIVEDGSCCGKCVPREAEHCNDTDCIPCKDDEFEVKHDFLCCPECVPVDICDTINCPVADCPEDQQHNSTCCVVCDQCKDDEENMLTCNDHDETCCVPGYTRGDRCEEEVPYEERIEVIIYIVVKQSVTPGTIEEFLTEELGLDTKYINVTWTAEIKDFRIATIRITGDKADEDVFEEDKVKTQALNAIQKSELVELHVDPKPSIGSALLYTPLLVLLSVFVIWTV